MSNELKLIFRNGQNLLVQNRARKASQATEEYIQQVQKCKDLINDMRLNAVFGIEGEGHFEQELFERTEFLMNEFPF